MSTKEILEESWASKKNIEFESPEAEENFDQRARRIIDAFCGEIPDRMPISIDAEFTPLHYTDTSLKEAMYDYEKAYRAWKKTIQDFKWDAVFPPFTYSGKVMEILGYNQLCWPGFGVDEDASIYQFLEPGKKLEDKEGYEPMSPEDYDLFLNDPSDYIIRKYLPKIADNLKSLSNLYPIHGIACWYQGIFESLATPGVAQAFECLAKATKEAGKWIKSFTGFVQELKSLGFPVFTLSVTHAPFDYIANFLRGTQGALTDLYRRPEKVKETCDKLVPFMTDAGIAGAQASGNPIVTIFLHKGMMMRTDQYKEFYWPTLKRVVQGLLENDIVPYVYAEGDYTKYLEILQEMPKGKIAYHIEEDIFKAKEILGDKFCLTGGIPASLLISGTPSKVKDYCKDNLAVLAEDGGFILDTDIPLAEAKPENLKALNEAVLEYGEY